MCWCLLLHFCCITTIAAAFGESPEDTFPHLLLLSGSKQKSPFLGIDAHLLEETFLLRIVAIFWSVIDGFSGCYCSTLCQPQTHNSKCFSTQFDLGSRCKKEGWNLRGLSAKKKIETHIVANTDYRAMTCCIEIVVNECRICES